MGLQDVQMASEDEACYAYAGAQAQHVDDTFRDHRSDDTGKRKALPGGQVGAAYKLTGTWKSVVDHIADHKGGKHIEEWNAPGW